MSTDTFRRHTRACVDAELHRAFDMLRNRPEEHALLERMARVAYPRSLGEVAAFENLATFAAEAIRPPEQWSRVAGHSLRVIDSLARHLFARYPTPRFLASAWFGGRTLRDIERRRWFVAHAGGQSIRSLALPMSLTRRMADLFLRTPDHLAVDHALRRAEVMGLGGSPELADVVTATRLGEAFVDGDRWRAALGWLVRCGDDVDLAQVGPLVDYLRPNLGLVDLRGRTFSSVLRLVRDWQGHLGLRRVRFVRWEPSSEMGLVVPVAPTAKESRRGEWTLSELLDSHALAHEGRALRHCVSTYVRDCVMKYSTIWSLRHRWADEGVARSVLTIEVRRATRTIVQVRGWANRKPRGVPLELVHQWAAREGLRTSIRLPSAP